MRSFFIWISKDVQMMYCAPAYYLVLAMPLLVVRQISETIVGFYTEVFKVI